MTADIITLYIQIFCIITFTLYVVYVLAVIPLYKSLPLKIVKIYNSVMFDFAIFMAILMVFYVLNYLIFHIKHSLFISIELMITLSSGVLLLAAVAAMYVYVPYMLDNFENLVEEFFKFNNFTITKESASDLFIFSIQFMAKTALPIFALLFVLAIGINAYQVGFYISTKAIEPKFNKLNFFANFMKTFFNKRKVVELIKSLLKIFVLTAYAWYLVHNEIDTIVRMTDADYRDLMVYLGHLVFDVAIRIAALVLVIGIADYAYQKWQHNEDLKMTKQEIKEEYKQMEGDPIVKNRIRQAQRDAARQRMMEEVPKSDVVITNPTHYAVAIRYDMDVDRAPKVVAKGQRLMALKIKEIARASGVKIVEDPPLARTLYNSVEVDEEIPETLYKTLAQILMTLDKFRKR